MVEHTSERHYDPLIDTPPAKANKGRIVILTLVGLLHVALIYWLYKTKIETEFKTYSDTAVKVDLVKPPPPPPPPEPDKPPPPPPPPQTIQPRPPVDVPNAPPPPVTLDVKPVEKPVKTEAPPSLPPAPPAPHFITSPKWERVPNGDDFANEYPERALRLEKEGQATIKCSVRANGQLVNCSVVSESPEGYEFGAKSLKISRNFRMKPGQDDGKPIDGADVRFTIKWQLPR